MKSASERELDSAPPRTQRKEQETIDLYSNDEAESSSSATNHRPHRRPQGVLQRLRIVSDMVDRAARDLGDTLETRKRPADLDAALPRLRKSQQQLEHCAKRLDIHIARQEQWQQEFEMEQASERQEGPDDGTH